MQNKTTKHQKLDFIDPNKQTSNNNNKEAKKQRNEKQRTKQRKIKR